MENKESYKSVLINRSISWKTVFNTSVGDVWWGDQEHANKTAKDNGFKFYTWNGWVYEVDGAKLEITDDMLNEQITKNNSLILTLYDLEALYQRPLENPADESTWATVYRMGRNSITLHLISKLKKENDYDSN